MIVYWMFPLIDKWLESVTDGDLKSFLCEKYRNPFLNKFGLMEKTDRWGNVDSRGKWNYMYEEDYYRWKAVIVWWVALLGLFVNLIYFVVRSVSVFFDKKKVYTLHELTTNIAEFISTELAFPMIIVLGAILLNTTLKKLYKFGKKVKPLVDNINNQK
tara:strand:- start:52621 stop:53094 length:474 start_codon:yes stop_codon:yes gene_type:complete